MNYFNPYYYSPSLNYLQPKVGVLGRLFGRTGISISNFFNGTQKVLNIANQTIPLIKQAKPMITNAKTMFKVMNEFKRVEKPKEINTINKKNENNIINNKINNSIMEGGPTFFI